MGWAIQGEGVAYRIRGGHARALDLWSRDMELSRSAKEPSGVTGSLNNIDLVLEELGDLVNALVYHRQGLS